MVDPDMCGRIRERSVGIGSSVYYPPVGHLRIKERFDQFLIKAEAIKNPFEQSFFAMVHLPYLQAFEDVNKRVSRLAANISLVRHNLCPLSFADVPQGDYLNAIIGVYELNRIDYLREVFVWAYKRSAMRYSAIRETLGEPDPFRLQHRTAIQQCVRSIVQSSDGSQRIIDQAAKAFKGDDRFWFWRFLKLGARTCGFELARQHRLSVRTNHDLLPVNHGHCVFSAYFCG